MQKSKINKFHIEAELCKRSFSRFIKYMWKVADGSDLIHNWHIDVIADHLQELSTGNSFKRLLINIAPRTSKSMICNCLYPAWRWLSNPDLKIISVSYGSRLSTRDGNKSRQFIQTKKYLDIIQILHPNFKLRADSNNKSLFENTYGGYRSSCSIKSGIVGDGADEILLDDLIQPQHATSEAHLEQQKIFFNETIQSRLNNQKNGKIICIAQRICSRDIPGLILDNPKLNEQYAKVIIPMEYNGVNQIDSSLGIEDPRTFEGELMDLQRFDNEAIDTIKNSISPHVWATQYLQLPTSREGGLFAINDFRYITSIQRNEIVQSVISWDIASTSGGGCYSVGCVMHKMKDDKFIIENIIRGQWNTSKREEIIKQTAIKYGKKYKTLVEKQPASAGIALAEMTVKNLAGYSCELIAPVGNKEFRLEPLACQVQINNVYLIPGDWNHDFLEELGLAPFGNYLDQCDAASQAFNYLNYRKKSRAGAW